jgi:hypothetical protein
MKKLFGPEYTGSFNPEDDKRSSLKGNEPSHTQSILTVFTMLSDNSLVQKKVQFLINQVFMIIQFVVPSSSEITAFS